MIATLDESFAPGRPKPAICIVGSGAAGIALACELDACGLSVLLLEAGGLRPDAQRSDAMYGGSSEPPHPDPSRFRRVVFGGTTGIWGGRCVPFDPIDFEPREYVPGSGWPISYEEIARYYPRAMSYCDAGAFDFSVGGSLDHAPATIPGLDDAGVLLADRVERYSLPTDFGRSYRARIAASANVTALLHARCVRINRQPGQQRVASVEVVDRGSRRHRIEATVFVLAMGGIETTRLLLGSDEQGPGLGNGSGHLGRYYACHFENVVGRLVATRGPVAFDFERTRDGVYCRRKLQFSARAQREHRLLNMAFRLHFPAYSDASHGSPVLSAIFLAKSALIPEYRAILQQSPEAGVTSKAGAHLRNIALGLPGLGHFAWQWVFLRNLARRKLPYTLVRNRDGSYPVEFNSEQTPLASSRITLTDALDSDGIKRVHVDWRFSAEDAAAAQRGFLLLQKVLEQSSCRLEFDEQHLAQAIGRSVPLGGHHIGTTRMAAAPGEGVVDTRCALFELPNLFVASSAVFCTSSHANPTLTIVAFALRLADHLKKTLGAGAAVERPQPDARP
jgi:choline dehydrogenase-like flavoprotein